MLLTNGRSYTLDARGTVGDTLVVRDGRVAFADHRLRIEHAQILTERDVPRFARLGVLPSMRPNPLHVGHGVAAERLGAERLRGVSPNQFHGIHAAVTRRPRTNDDHGWQPEQRMTVGGEIVYRAS